MKVKVKYAGAMSGKHFAFKFLDSDGNIYILDENAHSVKGMNPFVYDQITSLTNVDVCVKEFEGQIYITEIKYSPK